ncbi:MAG TPA: gephyrin-like molybdotransferase Glp [Candidatus Acidoferrum sp.]|nr:gephyrin-like molybdotransferase Glp [Candidatus Acidoferrum sp.]
MLRFEDARQRVIDEAGRNRSAKAIQSLPVHDSLGYVLAEEVRADREYPPFDRSTRDGYAVRANDAGPAKTLRCVGEIRAGDSVKDALAAGTCVQIMTGAAVPGGADAVVMIEFTGREGEMVTFQKETKPRQNIVPKGSEAHRGGLALALGQRLGFAELAIAAQVGATRLSCYKKPRVAILSTGDEIVPINEIPGPFHIRNSNSVSLGAQVRLAGGEPVLLGTAGDRVDELSRKIELGLREDMLILSGGVSMGKYDLVEGVLKSLGAEFFFDAVAVRPGKPTVVGRVRERLVFGLPGNPVSTMVTFQLFAIPAIDVLSGAKARPLGLLEASASEALKESTGQTHFLPGRIEWVSGRPQVKALRWQGSGDIGTLSKANCFVVVPFDRQDIAVGEIVSVLPRWDVL